MTVPHYNHDFYSDAFIADPLPRYKEMRDLGPIVWLPFQKCYAVARYEQVVGALRMADVFISGKGLSLNDDVNARLIGSTLNTDGEQHHLQRSVTAPAIMPKNLEPLHPVIDMAARELVERLVAKGQFDAITDFAQVLPLSIVTNLVGLTDAAQDRMLPWAAAAFNLFEGFNKRSQQSMKDLIDLKEFLEKYGRRECLKEGGLARRIFDVAPEKGFTQEQAAELMRDYINPSLDTTISAAGFLAYYFAKQPEQWTALREHPDLIPNAIEEVVRLTTPIRAFSRYVAQDIEFAGANLKQGDRLIIIYASANRDERQFETPDMFDISRNTRKHVGFGHGIHTCMGLHLARMEMRALLEHLSTRVKSWHSNGTPEIAYNNTIRAFGSLPMRIEPL